MALYNPLLIKKLEEILKQDPASKFFCSLAQIYLSKGEVGKAEKLCLEGLIYNPSHSQAYVILAEIYKTQGQVKKAIKCLNKAKEFNPDNPNIYKNLAEIHRKNNDMEKTLNAYKMVSFLKPGDKTAIFSVQHLEKVLGKQLTEQKQTKTIPKEIKTFAPKALSGKENQKLAKLNKILARVENYIDEQVEKI